MALTRATDFLQLQNGGRNHRIFILSNDCNLGFLNRKLCVNKLNSNHWIAKCHMMSQSYWLHVKGNRKLTLDATGCALVTQS